MNNYKCPSTGKERLSRKEADTVKTAMLKKSNRRIRIYECPDCFHYHVTQGKNYTF